MLKISDLLSSRRGRYYLERNQVYLEKNSFIKELKPPREPGILHLLGINTESQVVYMGQQIYADYHFSTMAKIFLLRSLASLENSVVTPLLLWSDTDRAGSDKLMTCIQWPAYPNPITITLAAPGMKNMELRYVTTTPPILSKAFDRLATCLQTKNADLSSKQRLRHIRHEFTTFDSVSLCDVNHHLTGIFLKGHMAFSPNDVFVSRILDSGLLENKIDQILNRICDFIVIFNEEVARAKRCGVDVKLKMLPDDYLPFHYSCPRDNHRIKLSRKEIGGDQFAVGRCRCGNDLTFFLGSKILSAISITQTRRWSLDVTLPLFLNEFLSGVVLGKSSALYGIILNKVLQYLFYESPIPGIIPDALATEGCQSRAPSLMVRYLEGIPCPNP